MIHKHKKMKRTGNKALDTSTVGNLPGKVHLEIKENATPYQAPVCKVSQALHKPLKSELDKLVDKGVLHKLRPDKRSDWVSMPVCVKKSNVSL